MSGTPELTVTVPCATCGGFENPFAGIAGIPVCADCAGTGVTRTPVTCAGCKHADTDDPWSEKHRVWCFEHDHEFDATFGCLSWISKEATGNGNG